MNTLVPRLLRGMTDGYFVNIGHPEDTSALETEFMWEGVYIPIVVKPLHTMFEERQCPTILHYVTIDETIDAGSILKTFFDTVEGIPGWKRRMVIVRAAGVRKFMENNLYTYVSSEENYDYFIHTIWDVLV
jgi:hypothetical protein